MNLLKSAILFIATLSILAAIYYQYSRYFIPQPVLIISKIDIISNKIGTKKNEPFCGLIDNSDKKWHCLSITSVQVRQFLK